MANKLYAPAPVPNDLKQWPGYLKGEFERIARALAAPSAHFEIQYEAPAKPRIGDEFYADGTGWNPGSGEGLYVYKSTGWKFVA